MSPSETLRIGYADPPYPGQSKRLYSEHVDYAGEVDHAELVARLEREYDAWVLHTSSPALKRVLAACPDDARVAAWVKPFASFKKGVLIAYAWEPVIFKGGRRQNVSRDLEPTADTRRDWYAESITLERGLAGAKPEAVCHWLFDLLDARPTDELHDLFPGTGAVARAWESWCRAPRLEFAAPLETAPLFGEAA